MRRNVVRLSGSSKDTVASPSLSVCTAGAQWAEGRKSFRTVDFCSVPPPPVFSAFWP